MLTSTRNSPQIFVKPKRSVYRLLIEEPTAEQGREAPGECPVTPFGQDIGPVTCYGVTVFIHDGFFDHVNFD